MLRLIIQTIPVDNDLEDHDPTPTFNIYEVDCERLERHLSSPVPAMHRRVILGYEVFEAPKEPEKKAVNPELAARLAAMKNQKQNDNGKGNQSKFAKWEEKAKLAKQKEAKANGKAKRSWWGGRANGATN